MAWSYVHASSLLHDHALIEGNVRNHEDGKEYSNRQTHHRPRGKFETHGSQKEFNDFREEAHLLAKTLGRIFRLILANFRRSRAAHGAIDTPFGRSTKVGVRPIPEDVVKAPAKLERSLRFFDQFSSRKDTRKGGEKRERWCARVQRSVAISGVLFEDPRHLSRASQAAVSTKFNAFHASVHVSTCGSVNQNAGNIPLDLPTGFVIVKTGDHDVISAILAERSPELELSIGLAKSSDRQVWAAHVQKSSCFFDFGCTSLGGLCRRI